MSLMNVQEDHQSDDVENLSAGAREEDKTSLKHWGCMQPRQIAVWFQNRRARWKTRQLERDYDSLNKQFLKFPQ